MSEDGLHEYLEEQEQAQQREWQRQAEHMAIIAPHDRSTQIALYLHEMKGYEGLIIVDEQREESKTVQDLIDGILTEAQKRAVELKNMPYITGTPQTPNNRRGRRMNKRK